MIKLLIVDDEPIERESMQMILQKAFPSLTIKQAKNGKAAVEITNIFHPDIILMDIMMPVMTGLEAIEQIQSQHPKMKFVMVTAYDMFDYARQALKLGVKDYLLKPSKAKEIVAAVGQVLDEHTKEKSEESTRQTKQEEWTKALALIETDVVTQLLYDHVHEIHIDLLMNMLSIQSTEDQFVMVVLLPEGSGRYYSLIKEKVRKERSGWVGALYGRQLPIIVFRNREQSFRSQAIALAKSILSAADKDEKINWFIGIGNVSTKLEEIKQSYQESLIATMDTTLPVKFRFYSDVPVLDPKIDSGLVKEQEKQFFDQIRLGEWEKVRQGILDVIQRFEQEGAHLVQTQQRALETLWVASRIMDEMGIKSDAPYYSFQAQDYRQLRTETMLLIDRMEVLYENHYDKTEADKIYQIQRFIKEHSHEDISLEILSKKIDLSPIYISKLFKEKLGVNYIEFLTECRMEKAKKLLMDPDKSLKEISFDVGYHEPNYFSKVFKKMCGVSPKEYRKTLLNKTS